IYMPHSPSTASLLPLHPPIDPRLPLHLTSPFVPPSLTTSLFLFFFNDPATPEIYTLSLHDALPILPRFAWSTPQRQKLKFLPLRRYNLTLNLLSRSHD